MKTLPVLIAIAACSIAYAEPPAVVTPAEVLPPTFETLDRNADGQLTAREAQVDQSLKDNFAALDTTGRGFITKKQYDAYTLSTRSARVAKL